MSAALLLSACMAVSARAEIVVGLPPETGGGNCFPFGCAYNAEYQQVDLSSQFPGTITITDLDFYNTQFNSGATETPVGNYDIDLSYTTAGPGTLSGDFGSNIGADETEVFNGSIDQPWTFGNTLTINLTTSFTYDPSQGNLLMTVTGSGISVPGGGIFFDNNLTGAVMGRVYCSYGISCGPGVADGTGLVTGFSTEGTTTPEPGSISLLLMGIAAVGLTIFRERARRNRRPLES